jgi:hypothetical protein
LCPPPGLVTLAAGNHIIGVMNLFLKGLVLMSAFDPEGPAYQVLLEMKETLTRVDQRLEDHIKNPCAQCALAGEVQQLKLAGAGEAGARRVKGSLARGCFEIGKLAVAAVLGWLAGHR